LTQKIDNAISQKCLFQNCAGARLILLGVWIDSGFFQDQANHRGTEITEGIFLGANRETAIGS